MPIDANNTIIANTAGALTVLSTTVNALPALAYSASGQLRTSTLQKHPAVKAGNAQSTWTQPGTGWIYGNTLDKYIGSGYNHGSHHSTTTGQFTAPVAGFYILTANRYWYEAVNYHQYVHPAFLINGNLRIVRATYSNTPYRLRNHHRHPGYGYDVEISQVVYLETNDYVEHAVYVVSGNTYFYGPFGCFNATLLG